MSTSAPNPTTAPPGRASRYRPMLLILLAIAGGVWIDDALHPSPILWFSVAIVSALIWLALWTVKQSISLVAIITLVLTVGGLRNQIHQSPRTNELGSNAPTAPAPIVLEGVALTGARIVAPPERTPMDWSPGRAQTYVLLTVTEVRDGQAWRAASGKCWLRVIGDLSEIGAGDRLRVFGEAHDQASFNESAVNQQEEKAPFLHQ